MPIDEREILVIGDLHGCHSEFNALLKKIDYHPNKHRVVLVNDILDRGPDPVGLLHQVQDMGLEAVLSNHEEKALRWRRHEAFKELTGKPNPMKEPSPQRRKEWESLTKEDLKWIQNLPYFLEVKSGWVVLHGGVEPGKSIQDQDPDVVIRMRWIDKKTGKYIKPKDKEQPKGSIFWAEVWDQPINIIFGHTRFKEPKIFKNKNNICVATDTSCVYGGSLTAYNINKNEFISVKAERKYYP